jgi:hypothetical protein
MGDPSSNGAFGAPKLGKKSFITPASPGPRNPTRSTAGSVASVNGKKAMPGGDQKIPQSAAGGKGTMARPGGAQKIRG